MHWCQKQVFCVGGRHLSCFVDIIEYEELNPKAQKSVEGKKGKCDFRGGNKSQIFNR